ncbi:MAG: type II toxin-antitoxin system HicB family antitoxin [Bacteroidales bacterium]|nr:type II toxin-antitoxin system HicB family antitoxin [Bacteroidales bacterium]
MGKVIINVDWVPNNFGASPANEDIACVATGKTLEEVEKNIVEALEFHLDGMREDGEAIPEEFLGEWEPEFLLSTRAQLKYADNFITRKALARETGIAEQQLSHYANGQRHPRPAMQQRISDGIQAISRRLAFIF